MNHMMCCHLVSDKDKEDAMVIHIFVAGIKDIPLDRDTEVMAMQVSAHIKVAQPVYALFKNGIVYKYGKGRTLNGEDLKNPTVVRYLQYQ